MYSCSSRFRSNSQKVEQIMDRTFLSPVNAVQGRLISWTVTLAVLPIRGKRPRGGHGGIHLDPGHGLRYLPALQGHLAGPALSEVEGVWSGERMCLFGRFCLTPLSCLCLFSQAFWKVIFFCNAKVLVTEGGSRVHDWSRRSSLSICSRLCTTRWGLCLFWRLLQITFIKKLQYAMQMMLAI